MLKSTDDVGRGLFDSVERFVTASSEGRAAEFSAALAAIKRAIVDGQFDSAASAIARMSGPHLDYTSAQSLSRLVKRLRGRRGSSTTTRLAVLASFTSAQLVEMVELFLLAGGVEAEFYESDFGL